MTITNKQNTNTSPESYYKLIIKYLKSYFQNEFEEDIPSENIISKKFGITYTELGNENQYPCQVYIDLDKLEITYEFENQLRPELTETFNSIKELYENINGASFEDYIEPFYDLVPENEL